MLDDSIRSVSSKEFVCNLRIYNASRMKIICFGLENESDSSNISHESENNI